MEHETMALVHKTRPDENPPSPPNLSRLHQETLGQKRGPLRLHGAVDLAQNEGLTAPKEKQIRRTRQGRVLRILQILGVEGFGPFSVA